MWKESGPVGVGPDQGFTLVGDGRDQRDLQDPGPVAARGRAAVVLGRRSRRRGRADAQRGACLRAAQGHRGRHLHGARDEPSASVRRAVHDPAAPGPPPRGRLRRPHHGRSPDPRSRERRRRARRSQDPAGPDRLLRSRAATLGSDSGLRRHGLGRRPDARRGLGRDRGRLCRSRGDRLHPAAADPSATAGVLPAGGRRPGRHAAGRGSGRHRRLHETQPGRHGEHHPAARRGELHGRDPGRADGLPTDGRGADPGGDPGDRRCDRRSERRAQPRQLCSGSSSGD